MNQQNINIDLATTPNVECEECEGVHFTPTFIIKHIHALMSPNGQETFVPLQVFKCNKCDHINKLFLQGITN
jgi:hypothetical protein